jgi:hypothetical protein
MYNLKRKKMEKKKRSKKRKKTKEWAFAHESYNEFS